METIPKRIYVVDDDAAFLRAILRLIRLGGYEPIGVRSISALVALFPLPKNSCVLADVLLDGESGLDIPSRLAAENVDAPVIFMSATDDEAMLDAAGRSVGRPCLRKPIEARQLFAALDAAFDKMNVGRRESLKDSS